MGVPQQRNITVHKEPTNKENPYTLHNLEALDEAANRLQSKSGFKLYMYLAKNQDKYNFDLSSNHFMLWSGSGYTAYTTAFDELEKHGYLVRKEGTKTVYTFYDKPQKEKPTNGKDLINIENDPEVVNDILKVKAEFHF